jgi:hypothetical protein
MMERMKGLKIPKNGQIGGRNLQQMASIIPPNIMKQMGGMANVQNLLKSMSNMNLGNLRGMFGGGE